MKNCKKCSLEKVDEDFYNRDSTCKPCRREMVRLNRARNAEYYRSYDKKRFQEDPKVKARHKRYQSTEAGTASMQSARKRWESKNTIKKAASTMVGNAVRDGRLIKPSSCEKCGNEPKRLHGHHDDYAYPLIVRWLCSKCHREWHEENGEGANAH